MAFFFSLFTLKAMNNSYVPRVIDELLDEYSLYFPAIALEGPKGVGKTETARQRAISELQLDTPATVGMLNASPELILEAEPVLLIDEWQRYLPSWDLVRRAVDNGAAPGTFLLSGSAFPPQGTAIHSGAGRIDTIRMRPFGAQERGLAPSTVTLSELFDETQPPVSATEVAVSVQDYARYLCPH